MMLDIKYQESWPWGFRQDVLKFTSRISIFSLCDLDMLQTGTI